MGNNGSGLTYNPVLAHTPTSVDPDACPGPGYPPPAPKKLPASLETPAPKKNSGPGPSQDSPGALDARLEIPRPGLGEASCPPAHPPPGRSINSPSQVVGAPTLPVRHSNNLARTRPREYSTWPREYPSFNPIWVNKC